MNKKTFFLLAAALLFAVIIRLVFFSGIGASDDLLYTSYSYDLSKGDYSYPATHHGTRLGILYPTGLMYSLFGVNEFSSNFFVFAASIAGIILVFYFGKEFFDEKTGLIAAFLLSFFPLDVIFATKLLPDLPSAFFLSLGVFFFLVGEKQANTAKSGIHYAFSGLAIGLAYLIRESTLLIVLFFLAYAVFYRKFRHGYFLIFAGFIIFFLAESYVFWIKTGDFLYRFHSLVSYYPTVVEADRFFGRGSFPFSLLHFPYIMFTSVQFGLFFHFILIAAFYCVRIKNKKAYPFILWSLSLLLYMSLGTVSLTKYLPFAAIPRYLMIIAFPSIILLSVLLSDKNALIKKIILPSALFMLFVTSIGFIYLDKDARHSIDNARKIHVQIESLNKPVYTDYRSKLLLEYLSGYKTKNIKNFIHVEGNKSIADVDLTSVHDNFIWVDNKLIRNLMEPHPFIEFPKEIFNPPKNWVVVKKINNEDGDGILYYSP